MIRIISQRQMDTFTPAPVFTIKNGEVKEPTPPFYQNLPRTPQGTPLGVNRLPALNSELM